ncbi:uncharacterized protein N0V89_010026 [Didymosphaeria variabile]|uniref:Uncharacterized protein n=1 Tax=Didymosphaeria variabile TaxID=1932322 RepID=A0A9W8XEF7_9PLEO|nr:uncharacterized protein N0V89_010026 [Didymosphaeria variabile]KAJ4348648.1 hypothetical protein N0V89_010026 [Didymosphaeria variabile]
MNTDIYPTLGAAIAIFITIVYQAYYMYTGGSLTGSPWGCLIAISMVVGEPILRTALAVTTAKSCDTNEIVLPLSFGWLSHAVTSLLPVLAGVRGLMPEPEIDCQIVNMKSGKSRKNKSWVLASMVRDLEKETDDSVGGLNISVYEAGKVNTRAVGDRCPYTLTNFTFWVQFVPITVVELFRISHPKYLFQDSALILLLVFFGMCLSILTTQLSAWRAEKFTARADGGDKNVYALTRGDGHRHVFIIRNCHGKALNLEDLAVAGTSNYDWFGTGGGYILIGTTLGWLAFTVVACHLTRGAALLFGVLALGSVSNIITAACPADFFRRVAQYMNTLPGAYKRNQLVIKSPCPIDLTFRESLSHGNVMEALKNLETRFPGYGEKLLKIFFPTQPSPEDELFWANAKAEINREHTRGAEETKDGNNQVHDEVVVEPEELEEAMGDAATPTSSSAFLVGEEQGSLQKVAEEDDNVAKKNQGEKERRVIEGEGTSPKSAYLKSRRRG